MMSISIDQAFEAVGVLGFGFYILAYLALTLRWITSHSIGYFALNLLAAIFLLISLTVSFNLGSLLIQIFWIAISVVGLFVVLREAMMGSHTAKLSDQPQSTNFMPESKVIPVDCNSRRSISRKSW